MIVTSIFDLLENKTSDHPMRRIQESIKLLLIINNDIEEKSLSSLINLIMNNEDCQVETLKQVQSHFQGNWS